MIQTSNEYKEVIKGSRIFHGNIKMELKDGTILQIDDQVLVKNSMKFEDATSGNGSFDLGSVIINQFQFAIYNFEEKFSRYEFEGATVYPQVIVELGESVEIIKKGVFIVETAEVIDSRIQFSCLDNMQKFERPYTETRLTYPATLNEIVKDACACCQVELETEKFDFDNFVVEKLPDITTTTFREILSAVAQIAGCYARCNVDGKLELKWYDFEVFKSMDSLFGGTYDFLEEDAFVSGDIAEGGDFTGLFREDEVDGGDFKYMNRYHHIYKISGKTIGADDVIITGVKVIGDSTAEEKKEKLFGEKGYVIVIENNQLISDVQIEQVAEHVGKKIVGMKFRPLSVTALSDPSIEAGDMAYITDNKGNTYQTILTNVAFSMGGLEKYTCDAKAAQVQKTERYSNATKTIVEARRAAGKEIDRYDTAVQQMNQLAANTFGFYFTEVRQNDGSRIAYRHNKPTLRESNIIYKSGSAGFFISTDGGKTYASGFDANGNAVMNILSVIGLNADWINTGTLEGAYGYFKKGFKVDVQVYPDDEKFRFVIDVGKNGAKIGTVYDGDDGQVPNAYAEFNNGSVDINAYDSIDISAQRGGIEFSCGGAGEIMFNRMDERVNVFDLKRTLNDCIKTAMVSSEDQIVEAGKSVTFEKKYTAPDGYVPLGIVGVSCENAASEGINCSNCLVSSFWLTEDRTTLKARMKNILAQTSAKVHIVYTVLLAKTEIVG